MKNQIKSTTKLDKTRHYSDQNANIKGFINQMN